jgi:cysteinyl-tRNA synthetase
VNVRIYNSLSRKIEAFVPLSKKQVKLYTCGPTVYARPHIGNYRTYVWEDVLKRYLLYKGYKVLHAMNITDFDNTILREAKRRGVPIEKLTRKSERLFMKDISSLSMLPADAYPHARDYAGKMNQVVQRLLAKKAAYKDERGRVFFDISSFPSYGKLAGKILSKSSRRVMREEYKPSQAGDFLIWKPSGDASCLEPPWNIQCATMAEAVLGSPIDISMGGIDNRFNHHENTRAIASVLCGKECCRYWVHIRHLLVNGQKMSKSKGNIILLPDMARKGFPPKLVRFILLSVHYRRRLNFTWGYAKSAKKRYMELKKAILKLKKASRKERSGSNASKFAALAKQSFESAMDMDLNAPKAIEAAEKFAKMCASGKSPCSPREALRLLSLFDSVLACLPI